MRISDWSSDVCSSDLVAAILAFVDGDGACDIAECGHGAPTGNWIAVVIVAGGSFRRALGWFGGLLFGKAGMALLLEAAFAVLAKAVVFSLDRQLLVQTTHLSAPVVGPRRGMIAPAPIREFGRRHHARREIAILVIAQLLDRQSTRLNSSH